MSSRKYAQISVIVLLLVGILVQFVIALDTDPSGFKDLVRGESSVFNGSLYPASNTTAMAGNITEINLSAVGPTRFWQGYYGEITGEIVLEDGNGNTFYNWSSTEPQGQIFASVGSTIDWVNVDCLQAAGAVSFSTEEALYDIAEVDGDGIVDTFTANDHPDFYIGDNFITGCNTTWTNVNSAAQTARFPEVILEDETNSVVLYATIIENRDDGNGTDVVGFDGNTHDFQFMVPENGTSSNLVPTTYYFWASIY